MKKSLLALAVLGTFAGVASAQSSVTLFGIVDVGIRNVKNGSNADLWTQSTDGLNSSRLGFRGVEDLGGGLSAGFWLEAGLAADAGNMGGSNWFRAPTFNGSSNIFNRRSTVSLMAPWGEIRLGRDYTPGFWNTTIFDPFGTNGVGSFLNMTTAAAGRWACRPRAPTPATFARTTRSATSCPATWVACTVSCRHPCKRAPRPTATSRAAVASATRRARSTWLCHTRRPMLTTTDWEHINVGGSWNFGFMSLMGFWDKAEFASADQENILIGAIVPFGQGEFKIAYTKSELNGNVGAVSLGGSDADQLAIGYVYNVSKRTALYGALLHHQERRPSQLHDLRWFGRCDRERLEGLRTGCPSLVLTLQRA